MRDETSTQNNLELFMLILVVALIATVFFTLHYRNETIALKNQLQEQNDQVSLQNSKLENLKENAHDPDQVAWLLSDISQVEEVVIEW